MSSTRIPIAATWVAIGCEGHTHVVLIDGRWLRWRCQDRHCPEAQAAKGRGLWAFHVHDTLTGGRWTEPEPVRTPESRVA